MGPRVGPPPATGKWFQPEAGSAVQLPWPPAHGAATNKVSHDHRNPLRNEKAAITPLGVMATFWRHLSLALPGRDSVQAC
jgi:hypothetical protein